MVEVLIERWLGRTEVARQITNEPWSSMRRSKKTKKNEREKTLLGEKKEVCSKKI